MLPARFIGFDPTVMVQMLNTTAAHVPGSLGLDVCERVDVMAATQGCVSDLTRQQPADVSRAHAARLKLDEIAGLEERQALFGGSSGFGCVKNDFHQQESNRPGGVTAKPGFGSSGSGARINLKEVYDLFLQVFDSARSLLCYIQQEYGNNIRNELPENGSLASVAHAAIILLKSHGLLTLSEIRKLSTLSVEKLLISLFADRELSLFVYYNYFAFKNELPNINEVSLGQYTKQFVSLLIGDSLLNEDFFDQLLRERPGRIRDILQVKKIVKKYSVTDRVTAGAESEDISSAAQGGVNLEKVGGLLKSLFNASELCRFVRYNYSDISSSLPPSSVSLMRLIEVLVGVLLSRGYLNDVFFNKLIKERPGRRSDIIKVRSSFLSGATEQQERAASSQPQQRPTVRYSLKISKFFTNPLRQNGVILLNAANQTVRLIDNKNQLGLQTAAQSAHFVISKEGDDYIISRNRGILWQVVSDYGIELEFDAFERCRLIPGKEYVINGLKFKMPQPTRFLTFNIRKKLANVFGLTVAEINELDALYKGSKAAGDQELGRVYKRKMKTEHTDVGGDNATATSLNVTRDELLREIKITYEYYKEELNK